VRGARANSPAPELPERPLFGTQSEEATGSYGSQRVVDAVEKRSLAERESVNSVLEVCDCCSAYCRRSKPVPSAGSDDRLVPVSVNSPAGRQRQQSLRSRPSTCLDEGQERVGERSARTPMAAQFFGIRIARNGRNLRETDHFLEYESAARPRQSSKLAPPCHAGGRGFEPRPLRQKS